MPKPPMPRYTVLTATGLIVTGLVAGPAMAGEMALSVEIPRLRVAEYHNPYVAVWIEDASGKAVRTLDVRYDVDMRGGEGTKWLADLRTWWRRAGRSMAMPADGISRPTQAPGTYRVSFSEGARPLGKLAAGQYKLMIEAAREVGGREVLSIPFAWPPKQAMTGTALGKSELGAVRFAIKP